MKFPQLSVGQRFQYQGEILVKAGPLTACGERGGGTRMIPRSAVVIPLTAPRVPATARQPDLDATAVQAAVLRFEDRWRTALEGADQATRTLLEPALADAQAELLRALGGEAGLGPI